MTLPRPRHGRILATGCGSVGKILPDLSVCHTAAGHAICVASDIPVVAPGVVRLTPTQAGHAQWLFLQSLPVITRILSGASFGPQAP